MFGPCIHSRTDEISTMEFASPSFFYVVQFLLVYNIGIVVTIPKNLLWHVQVHLLPTSLQKFWTGLGTCARSREGNTQRFCSCLQSSIWRLMVQCLMGGHLLPLQTLTRRRGRCRWSHFRTSSWRTF